MQSAYPRTDIKPGRIMGPSKSKLASDLSTLVSDAEEFLRTAGTTSGAAFDQARARFEERIRQFKSRIPDAQALATSRYREAAASADEFVRQNPWPMVGVAAAIGIVAGFLVARR